MSLLCLLVPVDGAAVDMDIQVWYHLFPFPLWVKLVLGQFLITFFFMHINVPSLFTRYFLHLHFKYYPQSPLYPPPTLLPNSPTPASWPWHSPVLGHIRPRASPPNDDQLGHPLLHMQLETRVAPCFLFVFVLISCLVPGSSGGTGKFILLLRISWQILTSNPMPLNGGCYLVAKTVDWFT